jgi:hypothetical protein
MLIAFTLDVYTKSPLSYDSGLYCCGAGSPFQYWMFTVVLRLNFALHRKFFVPFLFL